MRPMGGVLGGITALGGAVEHQGMGTPHFHFEVHVACAYQYGTSEEIARKIKGRDDGPFSGKVLSVVATFRACD